MSINAWRISLYTEPRKPETEATLTTTTRKVDDNTLFLFAVLWIQIRIKVKDRIWIRIRIKVASRIRIRINVMRIRNTGFGSDSPWVGTVSVEVSV